MVWAMQVNVDANVNSGFEVSILMVMLTVVFRVNANVNSGFLCQC